MEFSRFLTDCKNLKCSCPECLDRPTKVILDFRDYFPDLDVQLFEGALLVHMTEDIKVVLNHSLEKYWLARLVIRDEVTDISKRSILAPNAVVYIFEALWGIRNYLTDELRLLAQEYKDRTLMGPQQS